MMSASCAACARAFVRRCCRRVAGVVDVRRRSGALPRAEARMLLAACSGGAHEAFVRGA